MAAGRKTILLVEDEAIVAMAEKAALEKYGYAVVAVSSGEAAVEAARTSPGIELVLMDIDLGAGLDGTQAARAILAERELPILFLSSHTEREVVEKTERISSYGYVVKDSSIAVLDASIKMAFKLFEANARLEASEARYRHSFDNAALGVCHVGLDGRFQEVNLAFRRMTGYSEEELAGRAFADITLPEDRAVGEDVFRRMVRGETGAATFEKRYVRKDGSVFWASVSTSLVRTGTLPDRFVTQVMDITGRVEANGELRERERALLRQNEVFASLLRCIPIGVFMVEAPSGKPILANEAAAELLGRGVLPDVTKDSLAEVYASYKAGTSEPYPLAEMPVFLGMSGVTAHVDDMEVHRPDGTKTLLEVFGTPVADEGGRVWASLVSFWDITEKKAAEARIRALLAEKELLLREVHHRVKNNMATMGSLLSLQAESAADPYAKEALLDAEKRLRSMGLLYDRLYRSPSLVALSAREYLEPLVDEILEKLMPGDKAVSVEKSIEDFTLDADRLQPLGIIVNELLSNALKHAFKGRSRGRIAVSAWSRDGRFTLRVEDDGVGLPPSVDFDSAPGFGLRLVKGLAEQLGGTARIERGGGTRFVLEFGERGPAG